MGYPGGRRFVGSFAIGEVVLIPFPFTNQNGSKVRPAIVVSGVPGDDNILCAVTSQCPHVIPGVEILEQDFASGSLRLEPSYALPSKLLVAEDSLIRRAVGTLEQRKISEIRAAIKTLFED
jgi:mRNA interferase MazF